MADLFGIFLNVVLPVFLLVGVGYVAGPRLELDGRTLSRFAYFVLIPAFTYEALSRADIDPGLAVRMTGYTILTHLACAALAFLVARALKRSAEITAAYVLIVIFGNVGNFGLPLLQFRFPGEPQAQAISTLYFLAIMTVSFVVGVAAANWAKGGSLQAVAAVLKTPALIVVPPALLANYFNFELPLALARPVNLLGAAMIPTMLIVLGIQLAKAGRPVINADVWWTAGLRLVASPLLALALAAAFGLSGLERSIGVIQAAMPTAVLSSIIALENDLAPPFVITTVLFSTVLSIATLTVVLTLV